MSDQATKHSKYWTKLYRLGWLRGDKSTQLTPDSDLEDEFREQVVNVTWNREMTSKTFPTPEFPHFPRGRSSFESTENLNRRPQSAG